MPPLNGQLRQKRKGCNMCLFGGGSKSTPAETPPPPRDPDPQRQAINLQENSRRRRAAAFSTRATTLTSPLGVSNHGAHSRPGVTVLGRA